MSYPPDSQRPGSKPDPDEAPETPTNVPPPIPVQDPLDEEPTGPYVVDEDNDEDIDDTDDD
jgi:hypothetical protein